MKSRTSEDQEPIQGAKAPLRKRTGVFVQLTSDELERLEVDSATLKWSKQRLLLKAYFSGGPITLLMDRESTKRFLTEHKRIGVNINQLAAKANSGDLVSESALQEVKEQYMALYRYVMRFNGGR